MNLMLLETDFRLVELISLSLVHLLIDFLLFRMLPMFFSFWDLGPPPSKEPRRMKDAVRQTDETGRTDRQTDTKGREGTN